MRFALAGGGTGGHVYPALSVAEALRGLLPDVELLYIGTPGGAERQLVPEAGIPFQAVRAGQVRGKAPWRVGVSGVRLGSGVLEAARILRTFRPGAVFATGGYASVPVVIAARLLQLPLVVFLPDVYPGWAVRLGVRLATAVATSTSGSLEHLPPAKSSVTGYPVRPDFWRADRAGGRRRLRLGNERVLLVSGASSGSLRLNGAVLDSLEELLRAGEVIHLTGARDAARILRARDRLPAATRARYHVHGYLAGMAWAMAATDLAVLRAGASSLAEPPAVGLPTILVPGSFSDQGRNADFMQAEGAAVRLDEPKLAELPSLVGRLFAEPGQLEAMRAAARRLARPNAAQDLARLLLEAGGIREPTGVPTG